MVFAPGLFPIQSPGFIHKLELPIIFFAKTGNQKKSVVELGSYGQVYRYQRTRTMESVMCQLTSTPSSPLNRRFAIQYYRRFNHCCTTISFQHDGFIMWRRGQVGHIIVALAEIGNDAGHLAQNAILAG